jgi:hypothetical protein
MGVCQPAGAPRRALRWRHGRAAQGTRLRNRLHAETSGNEEEMPTLSATARHGRLHACWRAEEGAALEAWTKSPPGQLGAHGGSATDCTRRPWAPWTCRRSAPSLVMGVCQPAGAPRRALRWRHGRRARQGSSGHTAGPQSTARGDLRQRGDGSAQCRDTACVPTCLQPRRECAALQARTKSPPELRAPGSATDCTQRPRATRRCRR